MSDSTIPKQLIHDLMELHKVINAFEHISKLYPEDWGETHMMELMSKQLTERYNVVFESALKASKQTS